MVGCVRLFSGPQAEGFCVREVRTCPYDDQREPQCVFRGNGVAQVLSGLISAIRPNINQ